MRVNERLSMLHSLRSIAVVLAFVDAFLVMGMLQLAVVMRLVLPIGFSLMPGVRWVTPWISWVILPIWLGCFYLCGSHRSEAIAIGRTRGRALVANGLGLLFLIALLFFDQVQNFSRLLLGYFFLFSTAALIVRHSVSKWILRAMAAPFQRRVLLVGGGELGCAVLERLRPLRWGLSLAGIAATDHLVRQAVGNSSLFPTCSLDRIGPFVREHRIDDVMIAVPTEQHALAEKALAALDSVSVRTHFVPDILGLALIRATVVDFFGVPVVGLREPPLDQAARIVKRIFDLATGGLLTLVALPLMGICALAIKLQDGGPVFFRQRRVGENGTEFGMLKFRSMVLDAETKLAELGIDLDRLDPENPVFKIQGDPRITPVGRVLRRWSLDELPQFFNVLKGEMSVVGPRPEEIAVVAHYSPVHRKRLAIRPGLTGPMQVNGRGDLPLNQRVNLELAYIENWSLWSDIKILLKTVPVVLQGRGAY